MTQNPTGNRDSQLDEELLDLARDSEGAEKPATPADDAFLADFDDILGETREGSPEEGVEEDDLEAFLDSFEQSLTAEAAQSAAEAQPEGEEETAFEPPFDLAEELDSGDAGAKASGELQDDELDLSFGAAAEQWGEEEENASEPQQEPVVADAEQGGLEELDLDELAAFEEERNDAEEGDRTATSDRQGAPWEAFAPEAEASRVTEPPEAAPLPQHNPADPGLTQPAAVAPAPVHAASASQEGGNRPMAMAALAAAVLALVAGGGAGVLGYSLSARIEQLDQAVAALGERLNASRKAVEDPRIPGLQDRLDQLSTRVSELAVTVGGPMDMEHLQAASEQKLQALGERLDGIEEQLGSLANRLAARAQAPVPRPQQPAALPKTRPQSGWAVNLASLSTLESARLERERLLQAGIKAEVNESTLNGRTWYRLQVGGFESYEAARAYIRTVKEKAALDSPWVAKQP